jgi:hypothetical protein
LLDGHSGDDRWKDFDELLTDDRDRVLPLRPSRATPGAVAFRGRCLDLGTAGRLRWMLLLHRSPHIRLPRIKSPLPLLGRTGQGVNGRLKPG